MRILIVEDDERLARVMARVLRQERFDVDLAFDGETGLDSALTGIYDALIVDWMLPGGRGALIRELRAAHVATPVLMLTARGEIPQRVEGLNAGADDHPGKPFAFDELIARLRALARRRENACEHGAHDRRGHHRLRVAHRLPAKDYQSRCLPASSPCWRRWSATAVRYSAATNSWSGSGATMPIPMATPSICMSIICAASSIPTGRTPSR